MKLAELWHAATGRRSEEIFALRHCDIDTKRRKLGLRGNNWLAYDGLCRTQRLAKVLCIALIILYDWWLLLLLIVVVVVVLLLLPRLAYAIMSSNDRFASGDCCCFGGCCCGCGCVNLDSLSSCAPIASSSFVAFSITRGGNCPTRAKPLSSQRWLQVFSFLPQYPLAPCQTGASSCGNDPSKTGGRTL